MNRESRKIIAWGGTTPDDEETGLGGRGERRVWFFDLSAGPEAWGGNYDITFDDLDGDGEPDYRIPVAWEYAADGYRAPSELAGDLSKVARYAAINLMFTSSPLYPPYLTPRASAQVDQPRPQHLRGLDGRERERPVPEARLPRRGGERALPVQVVGRRRGRELHRQGA